MYSRASILVSLFCVSCGVTSGFAPSGKLIFFDDFNRGNEGTLSGYQLHLSGGNITLNNEVIDFFAPAAAMVPAAFVTEDLGSSRPIRLSIEFFVSTPAFPIVAGGHAVLLARANQTTVDPTFDAYGCGYQAPAGAGALTISRYDSSATPTSLAVGQVQGFGPGDRYRIVFEIRGDQLTCYTLDQGGGIIDQLTAFDGSKNGNHYGFRGGQDNAAPINSLHADNFAIERPF